MASKSQKIGLSSRSKTGKEKASRKLNPISSEQRYLKDSQEISANPNQSSVSTSPSSSPACSHSPSSTSYRHRGGRRVTTSTSSTTRSARSCRNKTLPTQNNSANQQESTKRSRTRNRAQKRLQSSSPESCSASCWPKRKKSTEATCSASSSRQTSCSRRHRAESGDKSSNCTVETSDRVLRSSTSSRKQSPSAAQHSVAASGSYLESLLINTDNLEGEPGAISSSVLLSAASRRLSTVATNRGETSRRPSSSKTKSIKKTSKSYQKKTRNSTKRPRANSPDSTPKISRKKKKTKSKTLVDSDSTQHSVSHETRKSVTTGACTSLTRRESRSSTGGGPSTSRRALTSSHSHRNPSSSGGASLIHMQSSTGASSSSPYLYESLDNASSVTLRESQPGIVFERSGLSQDLMAIPPPVVPTPSGSASAPASSIFRHSGSDSPSSSSGIQQQLLEQLTNLQNATSSSANTTTTPSTSDLTNRLSFRGRSATSGTESIDNAFQNLMEDVDLGRLQSLLEARGVSSASIFSNSRMHQVAQQMAGQNLSSNVNQRITQLQQSTADRSTQFTILQDINQSLLMGYEDNLASIHVKQLVQGVMEILRAPDLEELKSLGCNVLTHMMDVLPRSSDAVVPAIPLLLETMNNSALMDIFERVINALEHISRRHGRVILQLGGIQVVMRFFDFLTAAQQRTSLTLVGNCFLNLTPEDFHLIGESLPGLTDRIKQPDSKCVERVCTCFARLVAAYQNDESLLKKIAANNFFPSIQQLLMASPPIISSLQEVVHMLATMCASCSDLAVVLMKQNIAETLSFILVGGNKSSSGGVSQTIDNRRQEETYEIVNLIAEMMSRLPTEGMFSINRLLYSPRQTVSWLWLNDAGDWTPYSPEICQTLEQARRQGEDEAFINVGSRRYIVYFSVMQQQNVETSVTRRVQRVGPANTGTTDSTATSDVKVDSRAEVLKEHSERVRKGQTGSGTEAVEFIRVLFPLMLDVYAESSSASVKYKCLEAILRMIYPTLGSILEEILSQRSISSSIASMLASSDGRVVVGALQMAHLLLEKMPNVYLIYFKKEGVIFQLNKIVEGQHPFLQARTVSPQSSAQAPTSVSNLMTTSMTASLLSGGSSQPSLLASGSGTSQRASHQSLASPVHQYTGGASSAGSSSYMQVTSNKLTDIFRRKHSRANKSKRSLTTRDDHSYTVASSSPAGHELSQDSPVDSPVAHEPGAHSSRLFTRSAEVSMTSSFTSGLQNQAASNNAASGGTASKRQTILSHLNPSKWARSSNSASVSGLGPLTMPGTSSAASTGPSTPRHPVSKPLRGRGSSINSAPSTSAIALNSASRDNQLRQWISEQTSRLLEHFNHMSNSSLSPSSDSNTINLRSSLSTGSSPVINDILPQLQTLSSQLNAPTSSTSSSSSANDNGVSVIETRALRQLAKLLTDGVDLSPFEMQHSGLIQNLSDFLCAEDNKEARARAFIKIFLRRNSSVEEARRRLDNVHPPTSAASFYALVSRLIACLHQQEQFQVRASLDSNSQQQGGSAGGSSSSSHHYHPLAMYSSLLSGGGSAGVFSFEGGGSFLFGGGSGGGSSSGGASNSLQQLSRALSRMHNSGEIELSIQKHPQANSDTATLNNTIIKVDPITTIEDVEYLILRRCLLRSSRNEVHTSDSSSGEDEDSNIDDSLASITIASGTATSGRSSASTTANTSSGKSSRLLGGRLSMLPTPHQLLQAATSSSSSGGSSSRRHHHHCHSHHRYSSHSAALAAASSSGLKMQLSMNNQILPSEMPVYQAVKMYSLLVVNSVTDMDNEEQVNHSIWSNQHVVHYRLVSQSEHQLMINSSITLTTEPAATTTKSSRSGALSSNRRSRSEQQVAPGASQSVTAGTSSTSAYSSTSSTARNKRRRKDELWTDGLVPTLSSALLPYLTKELTFQGPGKITDPSLLTLTLLRILNAFNRYWYTLDNALDPYSVIPVSDFLSGKLYVKANRQLQDVFSVLAGNLPNWLIQLITTCPFLFPFDTRQNFFYAYNFDRDRTILRLQEMNATEGNNESVSSERLSVQIKRYKVTVSRGDKLLKQAEKTLQDLGKTRAMLEIAFEGEVGFGLGPTLEFYTIVSRELMPASLGLWHGEVSSEDESGASHIIPPPPGLYPRPLARNARLSTVREIKNKFNFLGRLLARALLDCRQLDLPLSPVFFKWLLNQQHTITAADLDLVDPNLARHVRDLWQLVDRKKAIEKDTVLAGLPEAKEAAIRELGVDDLYLVFVLPGYKIELLKNGIDIPVSAENLENYLRLVGHWTLVEGVQRQMSAMIEGFESVMSRTQLSQLFYPEELEWLFCGRGSVGEPKSAWDVKTLMESCCCDHGYTINSRSIAHLFEIMSEFIPEERRLFLQFVTGSPRLPVGGFRALKPPLKIVLKRENCENPDHHLPSVMTCQNYLKLPDYTTKELMQDKLLLAIKEGQLAFHLS